MPIYPLTFSVEVAAVRANTMGTQLSKKGTPMPNGAVISVDLQGERKRSKYH